MYLLDSNTIIARLNGDRAIAKLLAALPTDEVALCAPVFAELVFGAQLSVRSEQNLERVNQLARNMHFEPFGQQAAREFGVLKASLRRRGIAKSDFDLAIAAIAISQKAILVSHDQTFHDGTIDGLVVQDWLGIM